MMNKELLERLEQLETRLTFQDDTIEQLHQEISAQGLEQARLKAQLSLMVKRLQQLQQPSELASEADETPPPHY